MSAAPQLIQLGLEHHSAGRLQQAEAIYRQVLVSEPRNPDALHLLGVVAHQVGQNDAAQQLITQAISINPISFAYFNNLGEVYRKLDKVTDAVACYRRAIELSPNFPDAWSNLSIALKSLGQDDEAIAAARRAIELGPGMAAAYANLGDALVDRDPQGAVPAWAQAVRLNPSLTAAYHNMGLTLTRLRRFDEAIATLRRAQQLEPDSHEVLCSLSYALTEAGQAVEGAELARRSMAIKPDFAPAYDNLAAAYERLNKLEEAFAATQRSVELNPASAHGWVNLGLAHARFGRSDEAVAAMERSLALDPDNANAHLHYSLILLTRGDLERGWAEYEWRYKAPAFLAHRRQTVTTAWEGSDLSGKTMLLFSEQGLGDTIQFVRYAPLLADRGARVIVACQDVLHALVKTVRGVADVISIDGPMPPSDFQMHLLSLPRVLATSVETVPAEVPYLHNDPAKVELWRKRLEADPAGFRVGISWAGNPRHHHDATRSMPLAALAPLAQVPGVVFYSLQKGEAAAQAATPPPEMKLIDHTAPLNDFSDTAALLANLDLVISVDTAVVHLAGALGRKVWTLLPLGPDFRWMLEREDSPWYPTMRLFRKSTVYDWGSVIARVKAELAELAAVS